MNSSTNETLCCICFTEEDIDYKYLDHPLCFECYFNQLSNSLFDKDANDLTQDEKDEVLECIE